MAALLDDAGMAQRIFDHLTAGTTDLADGTWREPVANYRSQDRLDAELRVLRLTPAPFCPAAALPEVGSYLARATGGTPIVALRDADGRVRAFRNVCRHRGMELVTGAGCTRALTCRYHGWSYGLDGSLRHVPHEHGFPGLDKGAHGLAELAAWEKCGIVFVSQDPGARYDGSFDDVPDLIGADQRLFKSSEFTIPANWKIFLEGFLEGYHIKTTHPTTFFPFQYDNLNVVEYFGRNSRVTFPFQRIEKLKTVPPAERRVGRSVTFVYQLFPNVMVTVLSHHTVFLSLEPVSLTETRVVSHLLTNRPASDPQAQADAERDAQFVNQTGATEDAAVTIAITRGLGSGANEVFTYGRFEGAIRHWHQQMDAALAKVA
jgi:phenylpropionate dioxygenase-like ring-hydroxylating dioxygenase large terminal subunit